MEFAPNYCFIIRVRRGVPWVFMINSRQDRISGHNSNLNPHTYICCVYEGKPENMARILRHIGHRKGGLVCFFLPIEDRTSRRFASGMF
jgi:hypothetical protein